MVVVNLVLKLIDVLKMSVNLIFNIINNKFNLTFKALSIGH